MGLTGNGRNGATPFTGLRTTQRYERYARVFIPIRELPHNTNTLN